jgi:hypothetical protein
MAETMDLSVPGVSRGIEGLDVDGLRRAIQEEYALVAAEPDRGFHFHTGRRLAAILVYDNEWLDGVPEEPIGVPPFTVSLRSSTRAGRRSSSAERPPPTLAQLPPYRR